MALFISVVNHGHDEMIVANPTLASLAKHFNVIIKSNTTASDMLVGHCLEHNITLIPGDIKKGFGANNNEIFQYIIKNLNPAGNDYFLVLNPDVEIDVYSIFKLIENAEKYQSDISAINLFTDRSFISYDNSIRRYPRLFAPIKSLLGMKRNDVYDKSQINEPIRIEWAAGSFLLFNVNCFESLGGFDEKYFMYFEDADICTCANKKGFSVYYFPEIKAVHYASHQNRKLLSKHFIWYLESSIKYALSTL
ncbi:glycosyltransferase family 2 protein [Vibrio fluvialis]|uniref:glycosyltransferase family 2 protein n=1 Tax=Vibrio fluvialis TaxID=676 RepID=UPI0005C8A20F|nr:glycosyltransferase family 2 protein [Vibrio fluvialis]